MNYNGKQNRYYKMIYNHIENMQTYQTTSCVCVHIFYMVVYDFIISMLFPIIIHIIDYIVYENEYYIVL